MKNTVICLLAVLAVLSFSAHADDHSGLLVEDAELAVPGGNMAVPANRNDKAPPFAGTENRSAQYRLQGSDVALDLVPSGRKLSLLLPEGFRFLPRGTSALEYRADSACYDACATPGGAGDGRTMCTVERQDGGFKWCGIYRLAAEGTEITGTALVAIADDDGVQPSDVLQRVFLVAPAAESAEESAAPVAFR